MLKVKGLVWGLALALPGIAFGQQVVQETTTTTAPNGATTETRRISQIIGSNVALQGNNSYGKVEDVVLDQNGGIGYLVVANGGRYAMLPWNAANFNYGQRVATYNVTPQAIQPLFQQSAWPNITDQQFTNRMQQVFPGTGAVRRESLRPVEGVLPAPGGAVVAPGTAVVPGTPVAPGTVVAPGGPNVVKEKVKVRPDGSVKVKEKVR